MAMQGVKQDLRQFLDRELPAGEWLTITQDTVSQFGFVTNDRQYIHVDPAAAAASRFGGTIAHGLLVVSLLPYFLLDELQGGIEGCTTTVNYGFDRIRFTQAVKVGSAIRCRFSVNRIEEKTPGNFYISLGVVIDIADSDKPAMVADWLVLQY